MTKNMDRINELFEELVPMSGTADSLAVELVRAVSRIGYRFYNDGDQVGIGYGRETCNPAARFLGTKGTRKVASLVKGIWGTEDEEIYEAGLDLLCREVADMIEADPSLRTTPTEDMFSFKDPYEDVDDDEEEEDYYEEEEDDWE